LNEQKNHKNIISGYYRVIAMLGSVGLFDVTSSRKNLIRIKRSVIGYKSTSSILPTKQLNK
jgi:hypothetical protein